VWGAFSIPSPHSNSLKFAALPFPGFRSLPSSVPLCTAVFTFCVKTSCPPPPPPKKFALLPQEDDLDFFSPILRVAPSSVFLAMSCLFFSSTSRCAFPPKHFSFLLGPSGYIRSLSLLRSFKLFFHHSQFLRFVRLYNFV